MSITRPEGLSWLEGCSWEEPRKWGSSATLYGMTKEGWFVQAQLTHWGNRMKFTLWIEREQEGEYYWNKTDAYETFPVVQWLRDFAKDPYVTLALVTV